MANDQPLTEPFTDFLDEQLKDPESAAEYLKAAEEEGDDALLALAQDDVQRACKPEATKTCTDCGSANFYSNGDCAECRSREWGRRTEVQMTNKCEICGGEPAEVWNGVGVDLSNMAHESLPSRILCRRHDPIADEVRQEVAAQLASAESRARMLQGEREGLCQQLKECLGNSLAANPDEWSHRSQIKGLRHIAGKARTVYTCPDVKCGFRLAGPYDGKEPITCAKCQQQVMQTPWENEIQSLQSSLAAAEADRLADKCPSCYDGRVITEAPADGEGSYDEQICGVCCGSNSKFVSEQIEELFQERLAAAEARAKDAEELYTAECQRLDWHEKKAQKFASHIFGLLNSAEGDPEKWVFPSTDIAQEAADYLHTLLLVEKHPEKPWYRFKEQGR